MLVQRIDLGADVVFIQSRDLLVIHPDLDYAESLGAVAGTFPELHLDVVVGLVERVTPRPRDRDDRRRRGRIAQAVAAVAAAVSVMVLGIGVSTQPAAAAKFGDVWRSEMARMGLSCEQRDGAWTCVDNNRGITQVIGFRRDDASLYLVDLPHGEDRLLMIFDSTEAAQDYRETHPNAVVTGRVAAL